MTQILHLLALFLSLTPSIFAAQFKGLVAPITPTGSLYSIKLGDNEKFVIDIESSFSWYHCPRSFPRVSCTTQQCLAAQSSNNLPCHLKLPTSPLKPKYPCTCFTLPYNPITKSCASSQLTYTNLSIASTDGHTNLAKVSYKNIFLSCAPRNFVLSLPKDTSGVASFSRGPLSLISQFSNRKVPKIFGMCLGEEGVAFFGEGPFFVLPPPGRNLSNVLGFTALVKNPKDNLGYYVGLKSISVADKPVKFSKGLLAFDALGNGGVKISTVTLYTTLRTPIYQALVKTFDIATNGIPRVPKVAPFDLCMNTTMLGSTRVGLPVSQIDMHFNDGAIWSIFGVNSMVEVSEGVACLGFVDGGVKAKHAVVIGLHQMKHNFLLFDVEKSRLGFSSLLFFFQTTCNNFNFTMGVN